METIYLEDNHQDFLRIIGDNGVISSAEPFNQPWLVGREYMIDGDILFIRDGDRGIPLNHLIEKVVHNNN